MSSRTRRLQVSELGWNVADKPEDELAGDPLKGINVDAAGGASKVLKMLAEKVGLLFGQS